MDPETGTPINPQADDMTDSATVDQETAVKDEVSAEPQESTEDEQQTTDNDGSEPAKESEGNKEPKAVRELKEQRRKRQELEIERDYYKSLLEKQHLQSQQPAQPTQIQELKAPNSDDFADWEQYERARETYVIEKAKADLREEFKREQQEQQKNAVKQSFNKRLMDLQINDPDKYNKIYNLPIADRPDIIDEIISMDSGFELSAFLADNPSELFKLKQLGGSAMYRELGKIEARLTAPKQQPQTKKISTAPEPITPVNSGSGVVKKSLEDMTMEEFIAYRNKKDFEKRFGKR